MPANHPNKKQKRRGARPSGLSPVFALLAVVGVGALLVAGLLALQSKGSSSSNTPDAAVANGEVPGPKTIDSNPPREVDPAADGPRVYFNASAVDFGVVPLNTEVGYSFDLSNVGSGKLKIGGVSVKVLQGC